MFRSFPDPRPATDDAAELGLGIAAVTAAHPAHLPETLSLRPIRPGGRANATKRGSRAAVTEC